MKNIARGALAHVLLGAFVGAFACLVAWLFGKDDAFVSFPLYGSIGVTVLGVIGLVREEDERMARKDDQ